MSYQSIDALQKTLAKEVFLHTTDQKKASGRALGTLVEVVTYYLLRAWKLAPALSIEHRLQEFGNPEITHNVEFAVHPALGIRFEVTLPRGQSVSAKVMCAYSPKLKAHCETHGLAVESPALYSSPANGPELVRNATVIARDAGSHSLLLATLAWADTKTVTFVVNHVLAAPFALVECKRVGVEEGQKKGPTTIEKAKQGAYVAKHASSLQKIRSWDGTLYGALALPDGTFKVEPYFKALARLVASKHTEELEALVVTIGVVSNHGNWFTKDNMNKELKVLFGSYDWLLFLTDQGLAQFVEDLILKKGPVRDAFIASYAVPKAQKTGNQLTKSRLTLEAHLAIEQYTAKNLKSIEHKWFNVLAPRDGSVEEMRRQLATLESKKWQLPVLKKKE